MTTIKYYNTNLFRSVAFYVAIFLPFLIIFITVLILLNYNKGYWIALALFYIFTLPVEYLAIKYMKIEVTINDNEIIVRHGTKINKAKWRDIIDLKEFLFGHGQLLYELKTKDKKIIGFNDSIEGCDDLLKEIEKYTGLKFKQRL